jgi:hypothetical protein
LWLDLYIPLRSARLRPQKEHPVLRVQKDRGLQCWSEFFGEKKPLAAYGKEPQFFGRLPSTWVISEVLHTVCFLFKNEFILQNTFTDLQSTLSIVLYHSSLTFGKGLYSCLDAFVVDVSDYSCHLIRHLLKSKSGGLNPPDFDLFPKLKKPLRGKRFRSIEEVSNEVT